MTGFSVGDLFGDLIGHRLIGRNEWWKGRQISFKGLSELRYTTFGKLALLPRVLLVGGGKVASKAVNKRKVLAELPDERRSSSIKVLFNERVFFKFTNIAKSTVKKELGSSVYFAVVEMSVIAPVYNVPQYVLLKGKNKLSLRGRAL